MNGYINKAASVLVFLAVSLCAGCNGNATQTTTAVALSLIADDDTSEDDVLLDDEEEYDPEYGEWEAEEIDEVIEDVSGIDSESGETEKDEDEHRPDTGAEIIAKLQTNGQLVYGDKNFQIYYYGDTTDDDGNLTSVFGFDSFHGELVRITRMSVHIGTVIYADGTPLLLSPMNTLTDGYLCMSGDHGDDYYCDKPEEKWWTDNKFIYLRFYKDFKVFNPEKYAELIESKDGFYTPEEFSEVCGNYGSDVSGHYNDVLPICLYDFAVQTASVTEENKLVFEEPSEDNTFEVSINYRTNVIRVPFDAEKTENRY